MEQIPGLEPGASTMARSRSDQLSYICLAEVEGLEPERLVTASRFKTASSSSRTTSLRTSPRNRTLLSGLRVRSIAAMIARYVPRRWLPVRLRPGRRGGQTATPSRVWRLSDAVHC